MPKYYNSYKGEHIEKIKEKLRKRKCNLCFKEFEMGIFERFCKSCKVVAKNLDTVKYKVNLF